MIPEDSPLLAPLLSDDPNNRLRESTVTFGFADAGVVVDTQEFLGEDSVTIPWTDAQMTYVQGIFDYIETVVDLTFTEASAGNADIAFQHIPMLDGETVGFADRVGPGQSVIVLPTAFTGPTAFGDDNTTVIHEIGHALGLDHPFEGPDAFPGVSDPFDNGDFALNTELATRMAYAPGVSHAYPDLQIRGEPAAFGALDIAALHVMYGANDTTGQGDTIYGITPDVITIWDNGGNDLIDFSGTGDQVVIDLRAATLAVEAGGGGFFSFVGSENGTVANGGYTIAFGVVVEDARGGQSDDVITGNDAGNLLSGNAGDDMIDGGGGLDSALYSGNQTSFTLSFSAQETRVTDRREGGDGSDTLENIETLAFGDNTGGPFDLLAYTGATALTEAQMESVVELYIAYFNRAPDAIGLNFWGTAFVNGTTFEEMAALFTDQVETREAYPEGLSNADFTTAVYDNVLGRVADQEGFDFWVGVLDSGGRTRDQFILSVLEGAKTPIEGGTPAQQEQQGADQAYLAAKTDIGAYYSITKGLSDVNSARAVMETYDGSASSVGAAQSAVDAVYADAQDAESGAFILQLVGVVDDPFGGAIA